MALARGISAAFRRHAQGSLGVAASLNAGSAAASSQFQQTQPGHPPAAEPAAQAPIRGFLAGAACQYAQQDSQVHAGAVTPRVSTAQLRPLGLRRTAQPSRALYSFPGSFRLPALQPPSAATRSFSCGAAQCGSLAAHSRGSDVSSAAAGQSSQRRLYCAEPEAQEEGAVYTIDVFTGACRIPLLSVFAETKTCNMQTGSIRRR